MRLPLKEASIPYLNSFCLIFAVCIFIVAFLLYHFLLLDEPLYEPGHQKHENDADYSQAYALLGSAGGVSLGQQITGTDIQDQASKKTEIYG